MRCQDSRISSSTVDWPAETSGCQQMLPTDRTGLLSIHVARNAAAVQVEEHDTPSAGCSI